MADQCIRSMCLFRLLLESTGCCFVFVDAVVFVGSGLTFCSAASCSVATFSTGVAA